MGVQIEQFSYDDAIVRRFTLVTFVWGVVGMLVGLIVAPIGVAVEADPRATAKAGMLDLLPEPVVVALRVSFVDDAVQDQVDAEDVARDVAGDDEVELELAGLLDVLLAEVLARMDEEEYGSSEKNSTSFGVYHPGEDRCFLMIMIRSARW